MRLKFTSEMWHRSVIAVVALVLALPIVATVMYAFATSWGATILPDGFTLKWFERQPYPLLTAGALANILNITG